MLRGQSQAEIVCSSSKQISGHSSHYGQNVLIHPIIVLKLVSDPSLPIKLGYQELEVYKLYDEIQQCFAQKVMSVHGCEVIVVKVTIMLLKPDHKNPSIVSVHERTISHTFISLIYSFTEHIRNNL